MVKKQITASTKSNHAIKSLMLEDDLGDIFDKMNEEIEQYAKEEKDAKQDVIQTTGAEQIQLKFLLPKILWDRLTEISASQRCRADDLIIAGIKLIIEARTNTAVVAKARRRRT